MIVKIEKRKAHQHIVGEEFSEEFYLPQGQKFAEEAIFEAINEFVDFREGDLEEWQEKDLADLKQFKKGEYTLETGDFFYVVNINK